MSDPVSLSGRLFDPSSGSGPDPFISCPSLTQLGWSERWSAHVPDDPDLSPARVIAQHRGRWTCAHERGVTAAALRGRFRSLPAVEVPGVGDWVLLDRNETIVEVLPRSGVLLRKAAGGVAEAQVIAANVDIALVVMALDAPPNLRRLERLVSTVWESGATPVVIATKCDICADVEGALHELQSAAVGVEILLTAPPAGEGVEAVAALGGPGITLTLLGVSGAGKSTLANALAGATVTSVGDLGVIGKGVHTTTHRQMILLPTGALLIDTPGVREFGLWLSEEGTGVQTTFPDVEEIAAACRFSNCRHDGDVGCAIAAALDDGALTPDRVESWRKLHAELVFLERRHDVRLQAEERKRWAKLTRSARDRIRP